MSKKEILGLKIRETKDEFIENYSELTETCYQYGIRIDNTNLEEKYFLHVSNQHKFMHDLFKEIIPKNLVFDQGYENFINGLSENVKTAINKLSKSNNKITGVNRIDEAKEIFCFVQGFLIEEHIPEVWSPGDDNNCDY